MANNIFEQFDEAYSRWSLLDKVGKEMQLAGMWQQLCSTYNYIIWVWQSRGYLTVEEYNYKNQDMMSSLFRYHKASILLLIMIVSWSA